MIKLFDYQKEALEKLKTGSILQGGVGSGKSLTALSYFNLKESDKELYIITTARKRDSKDWETEAKPLKIKIKQVDSWNNIVKYKHINNAFFIFDEQRLIGSGTWVKSFLRIAKSNKWILLSATPGDVWLDYIPVFIANGFYKNRAEFLCRHVVYKRFSRFPLIDYYIEIPRLIHIRDSLLVTMRYNRQTISHHETIVCDYDKQLYLKTNKDRWNFYRNEPIRDISALCYLLRKISNTHNDRLIKLNEIYTQHNKVIVFYNFDYELENLEKFCCEQKILYSQWNGHKHEEILKEKKWLYLVQYTAGAEAWNCIETDCIVFFSQNYSYKIMVQAAGRIDRLNTPFTHLYYYHLESFSEIDKAIKKALLEKKSFNESIFINFFEKRGINTPFNEENTSPLVS